MGNKLFGRSKKCEFSFIGEVEAETLNDVSQIKQGVGGRKKAPPDLHPLS